MKIIFIGGVEYSLELLKTILENGWEISLVFSYDESKKIFYSDFASFDEITNQYKIKNVKVKNINDKSNLELIKKIKPDLILVMGWSQIIKNEILSIPKICTIGSHPTELPKYRGRAPLPWTILKNLPESALTFFYVDEDIDHGDILDQRRFQISKNDDVSDLYKKMVNIGKIMIHENLLLIRDGIQKRITQDESKFLEYWPKRTPKDGRINWNEKNETIHNLIRATTKPYPGAFCYFKKSELIIWKSQLSNTVCNVPGKIISIDTKGCIIGTGFGTLKIKKFSTKNSKITNNILDIFPQIKEGDFLS